MVNEWPEPVDRSQYYYWAAEYFDWRPFYYWVAPFAIMYVLVWIFWALIMTDDRTAVAMGNLGESVDQFVDRYPWLPWLGLGLLVAWGGAVHQTVTTPKAAWVEVDGDMIRAGYGRSQGELSLTDVTVRASWWGDRGFKPSGTIIELAQGLDKRLLIGGTDWLSEDPDFYDGRYVRRCQVQLSAEHFQVLIDLLRPGPSGKGVSP
jgi:hypothetical protein